ncbi:MAG: acetate--CoA ligase family protein [Candidatus Micrarchaeaceae archaeon]
MVLVDYEEGKNLLDKYRIKSIDSKYINNINELLKFSDSLNNADIALKVISQNPEALHKSKQGLVKLDLRTEHELEKAYNELIKRAEQFKPYKILAQKMVKGIEIIIGGKTDLQFGKVILIGLGGIYVEILKDFQLRICPVNNKDADEMIENLKSKQIILNNINKNKIADLLVNTSKLFFENNIVELDLNPVIIHDNNLDAVDIRIIK